MTEKLINIINTSLGLSKCRHCGCMRESIEGICERLEGCSDPAFYSLFCLAKEAYARLETVEYT